MVWALSACLAWAVTGQLNGATPQVDFATRAKTRFQQAETRYQKDTNDVEAAWQFARACFDFADFKIRNSDRAEIAQQGIEAAKQAVSRASNSAPAHYYLGMSLAQLARTKTLGALKIVGQMEREFSIARSLDEKFDDAGADRNLGLLYRDAPSIGSIGSRPKAREHLQNAVKVAPNSPDNRLNLAETYLKWKDRAAAQQELKGLEEIWSRAHTDYTGEMWARSWTDWEARFKQLKEKLSDAGQTR